MATNQQSLLRQWHMLRMVPRAPPKALTLTLVEQHLQHHLPPNAVDALRPHFQSAARTLSAVHDTAPPRAWLDKVRSVPPQQPLLPPRMDDECQRIVYKESVYK